MSGRTNICFSDISNIKCVSKTIRVIIIFQLIVRELNNWYNVYDGFVLWKTARDLIRRCLFLAAEKFCSFRLELQEFAYHILVFKSWITQFHTVQSNWTIFPLYLVLVGSFSEIGQQLDTYVHSNTKFCITGCFSRNVLSYDTRFWISSPLTISLNSYGRQNRSTEECSKLKRSVDMTNSGKNSFNIRTNTSQKWDRTRCPEE